MDGYEGYIYIYKEQEEGGGGEPPGEAVVGAGRGHGVLDGHHHLPHKKKGPKWSNTKWSNTSQTQSGQTQRVKRNGSNTATGSSRRGRACRTRGSKPAAHQAAHKVVKYMWSNTCGQTHVVKSGSPR